ncbi:MAG: zf-HC2 domain-containing protein [Betaproteobacteria bacterium]|nr:zf-HC2 domain-containing protein [Betaproteobacteria bacterium]
MLNCKQATALMSLGMDKKLGVLQKTSLRLHLMMCEGCRNFNKQMQLLREGLRKFPQQDS